jgi:hypothetical protein
MTTADATGDDIVVVPTAPGPLRRVPGARTPDEVDALLDDLFGPADDGGPGVADAVLATGGGATVVAGVVLSAPVVLGLGIGAVVLGSILPARSLWRRAQQRRLATRRAEVLGSGTPLRVSAGAVTDLVGAHDALFALVAATPDAVGAEERAAAHAAVADVAAVLGGGAPVGADEAAFVTERAAALTALVAGIEAASSAPSSSSPSSDDAEARAARLAARQEVDRIEGSSSADRLRHLAEQHHPRPADG